MSWLDYRAWPRAAEVAHALSADFEDIRREGWQSLARGEFSPWPEEINRGGWFVAGWKWQGEAVRGALERFAGARAVSDNPAVLNAGYSLMMPGAVITPHAGYTGAVLRMHLALTVPTHGNACRLRIGEESRAWEPGAIWLFDDTLDHEAFNATSEPRLIVLLDLLRDGMEPAA